jgi:hypothetical protein
MPATASKSTCPIKGRQYGPLMGIQFERKLSFRDGKRTRRFLVVVYAAYNAFGLIGPESNGVAILDEDRKQVLVDEIAKQPSGYSGASDMQVARAAAISKMGWAAFRALVNENPRRRYEI